MKKQRDVQKRLGRQIRCDQETSPFVQDKESKSVHVGEKGAHLLANAECLLIDVLLFTVGLEVLVKVGKLCE